MQKAATGKPLVVLDSTLNSQLIREVNPSHAFAASPRSYLQLFLQMRDLLLVPCQVVLPLRVAGKFCDKDGDDVPRFRELF